MNPTIQESQGECQHCGEHFIFSVANAGEKIACPHCGKGTMLRQTPQSRSHVIPLSILAGIMLVVASAYEVNAIKQNRETARQAAEQKERLQNAESQMVRPIAALKVRTEGCTLSELRQCETDVKTTYEVNKQQLSSFSTDIEQLVQLIEACELCWKNANMSSMMGGTIYPKQPGLLDAMKVIDPNVINLVDKPPYTTNYFNGNTFVKMGLAKISTRCESLLAKMQTQR